MPPENPGTAAAGSQPKERSNVTDPLRFHLEQALKGKAEDCYSPELARAMAISYAGDAQAVMDAAAAEAKLKAKFKDDLNLQRFRLGIRAFRDELSRAAHVARGDSEYLVNDKGTMLANVANAITMMGELPLAYDEFACRPILTAPAPWGSKSHWTDYDDVKCAEWCQHQHLNINSSIAAEAADAVARGNRVHPVRDYLKAQVWDGVGRIDLWLRTYLGCPDNRYVRAVAAKWMIAAVSRVMEPGCQADYTLVLEGTQGKRKSTALRILTGAWFADDITEIGTKDSAIQLQGKWIVEIAELDAFRRAEMTTIKAWLVRREDHFRPPYGRRAEDFPRQNVFAASTNKDDWGLDDTGLRRFWPVKVGVIDIETLTTDRDQLWAEAYARYSAGETSYLSGEIEVSAAAEQHERQDVDTWRDLIEAWLAVPNRKSESEDMRSRVGKVYLGDIMWHCLGIPVKDRNQSQKMRVGRILTLAGYIRKRESKTETDDDGVQREYWIPLKGS